MENESLKNFVQKIPSLPTLPVIAQEILMLLDDDLVSLSKLENIIENDPAISVRVMSLANSAFWGVTPVKTLKESIFRIGFNSVKYLALGVSLMTLFDNAKHNKADYQKIFNHSVAVGFMTKMLSVNLRLAVPDEILINGMLHDIGFLVINRFFPDSYSKILDTAKNGRSLIEAEKKHLDFTHAEIGSWLAEEWNLPDNIVYATRFHHEPFLSEKHSVQIAVVHLADFITARTVLSPIGYDPQYPFDPSCLNILRISDNDLKAIESKIKNGELFNGLFV